ncbi:MAG TPA: thioesterase family protein [Vicinamibacterales bacterium]|nr:thioesterase family protein [Vicinamibacterales bacterium]
MGEQWVELYRSVVMPAHCDLYGHMNVRHYAAFFDDAGFHIMSKAGISLTELRARGLGSVVASLTIDFHHELTAGQLIVITGGFTRIGHKSATSEMRLYDADTRTHCATQKTVEVFFDTTRRIAVPIPDDIKATLTRAVVPTT